MAKAPADLRSLARAHTELGIQTLAGIARNSTSDAARVAAVGMLLDRGWGRPEQAHVGADGGDIQIILRQIVEVPMKTIEHNEADRDTNVDT